jgi:hypothetical protein
MLSHGYGWHDLLRSRRRDGRSRWLQRLVRPNVAFRKVDRRTSGCPRPSAGKNPLGAKVAAHQATQTMQFDSANAQIGAELFDAKAPQLAAFDDTVQRDANKGSNLRPKHTQKTPV